MRNGCVGAHWLLPSVLTVLFCGGVVKMTFWHCQDERFDDDFMLSCTLSPDQSAEQQQPSDVAEPALPSQQPAELIDLSAPPSEEAEPSEAHDAGNEPSVGAEAELVVCTLLRAYTAAVASEVTQRLGLALETTLGSAHRR